MVKTKKNKKIIKKLNKFKYKYSKIQKGGDSEPKVKIVIDSMGKYSNIIKCLKALDWVQYIDTVYAYNHENKRVEYKKKNDDLQQNNSTNYSNQNQPNQQNQPKRLSIFNEVSKYSEIPFILYIDTDNSFYKEDNLKKSDLYYIFANFILNNDKYNLEDPNQINNYDVIKEKNFINIKLPLDVTKKNPNSLNKEYKAILNQILDRIMEKIKSTKQKLLIIYGFDCTLTTIDLDKSLTIDNYFITNTHLSFTDNNKKIFTKGNLQTFFQQKQNQSDQDKIIKSLFFGNDEEIQSQTDIFIKMKTLFGEVANQLEAKKSEVKNPVEKVNETKEDAKQYAEKNDFYYLEIDDDGWCFYRALVLGRYFNNLSKSADKYNTFMGKHKTLEKAFLDYKTKSSEEIYIEILTIAKAISDLLKDEKYLKFVKDKFSVDLNETFNTIRMSEDSKSEDSKSHLQIKSLTTNQSVEDANKVKIDSLDKYADYTIKKQKNKTEDSKNGFDKPEPLLWPLLYISAYPAVSIVRANLIIHSKDIKKPTEFKFKSETNNATTEDNIYLYNFNGNHFHLLIPKTKFPLNNKKNISKTNSLSQKYQPLSLPNEFCY